MNSIEVVVNMAQDDDVRSMASFVQKANEYDSSIYIQVDDKKINAKSIMGMISLGILKDKRIRILVEGEDEETAAEEILSYLNKDR